MGKALSEISNGTSVEVIDINTSELKVKLMEMGIVKGKSLKVLFRAPLGDPMAVDIEGYVLSLRKEEAELINVELIDVAV